MNFVIQLNIEKEKRQIINQMSGRKKSQDDKTSIGRYPSDIFSIDQRTFEQRQRRKKIDNQLLIESFIECREEILLLSSRYTEISERSKVTNHC